VAACGAEGGEEDRTEGAHIRDVQRGWGAVLGQMEKEIMIEQEGGGSVSNSQKRGPCKREGRVGGISKPLRTAKKKLN